MPQYSVIIPVYNRPDEIDELLQSLVAQTEHDFELIIVEDGSEQDCRSIIDKYVDQLDISYYFKKNTGPGDSRNYGMDRAEGEFFIFFDSDCIIPSDYFAKLTRELETHRLDAFGGSDDALDSFSNIQKAINYTMTSFLTTGGVRGHKTQLNKFQPRSFNMGIRKEVYRKVGGFSDIHPGEDPDLSFRILEAGFKTGLINSAFVYHKRRIDLSKFATQVHKFGLVRVILDGWYPKTWSVLYLFPTLFLLFLVMSTVLSIWISPIFMLPLLGYLALIFLHAVVVTRSAIVPSLVVPAVLIQFCAYGYGYLKSYFYLRVLGKKERDCFPHLFFSNKK